MDRNLDFQLAPDGVAAVRAGSRNYRLKMKAYRVESIPSDESSAAKLFAFARERGVQTIVSSSMPASLSAVDKLAGDGDPKTVMSAIEHCSPHAGVSVDFANWIEHGIRPVDGCS